MAIAISDAYFENASGVGASKDRKIRGDTECRDCGKAVLEQGKSNN